MTTRKPIQGLTCGRAAISNTAYIPFSVPSFPEHCVDHGEWRRHQWHHHVPDLLCESSPKSLQLFADLAELNWKERPSSSTFKKLIMSSVLTIIARTGNMGLVTWGCHWQIEDIKSCQPEVIASQLDKWLRSYFHLKIVICSRTHLWKSYRLQAPELPPTSTWKGTDNLA